MTKQIEVARNEVRKHKFGTDAYNVAFEKLSTLTKQAADKAVGTFEYTSIDGDIFAPR